MGVFADSAGRKYNRRAHSLLTEGYRITIECTAVGMLWKSDVKRIRWKKSSSWEETWNGKAKRGNTQTVDRRRSVLNRTVTGKTGSRWLSLARQYIELKFQGVSRNWSRFFCTSELFLKPRRISVSIKAVSKKLPPTSKKDSFGNWRALGWMDGRTEWTGLTFCYLWRVICIANVLQPCALENEQISSRLLKRANRWSGRRRRTSHFYCQAQERMKRILWNSSSTFQSRQLGQRSCLVSTLVTLRRRRRNPGLILNDLRCCAAAHFITRKSA